MTKVLHFAYFHPMDSLFLGYSSLFILSFLASTLLPVGSEFLLATMIASGYEASLVVVIATVGNSLGAFTTYVIGIAGSSFLIRRVLRLSEKSSLQAESIFRRYGSWTLLFSWVPVVGDPLCLIAGTFRMPFLRFASLVVLGKGARYAAAAWITLRALPHIG